MEIKDFHTISLVGGVYKIISKVLAIRMKVALDRAIPKAQNAFIRGRQILDQVLISNECLASRIRLGSPSMLCKQDLKMASDHVD